MSISGCTFLYENSIDLIEDSQSPILKTESVGGREDSIRIDYLKKRSKKIMDDEMKGAKKIKKKIPTNLLRSIGSRIKLYKKLEEQGHRLPSMNSRAASMKFLISCYIGETNITKLIKESYTGKKPAKITRKFMLMYLNKLLGNGENTLKIPLNKPPDRKWLYDAIYCLNPNSFLFKTNSGEIEDANFNREELKILSDTIVDFRGCLRKPNKPVPFKKKLNIIKLILKIGVLENEIVSKNSELMISKRELAYLI